MTSYSRIIGTGSYLPEKILANSDLEKIVDTSNEWIYARTGIRQRHIAADDQNCSDLALIASRRALRSTCRRCAAASCSRSQRRTSS